jgi:hypothetical protein
MDESQEVKKSVGGSSAKLFDFLPVVNTLAVQIIFFYEYRYGSRR